MPYHSTDRTFSRIWRFLDRFDIREPATRLSFDQALDDLKDGIDAALRERSRPSRADLKALIAGGFSAPDGVTLVADGLAYKLDLGATAIPDMPGVVPAESALPEHFGAMGNGTSDDSAALSAYFAYDGPKSASEKVEYAFSTPITIADGGSAGGRLRLKWTGAPSTKILDFGDDFTFDRMEIHYVGIPNCSTSAGTGFRGNFFFAYGFVQSTPTFITVSNIGLSLAHVKFSNCVRGMEMKNDTAASGGWIGLYEVDTYIRGFRALLADDFRIDRVVCAKRAADAAQLPGHNAILVETCSGWSIGTAYAKDSGEHIFRIGGSGGGASSGWSIGSLSGGAAGGCMFKINANGQICRDWTIGSIEAIADTANTGRNREVVRLSGAANGKIGSVLGTKADASAQGWASLISLNNVSGLTIGDASGSDIVSELLRLDGDQDNQIGDIDEIVIGHLAGQNFTDVLTITMASGEGRVGNVTISSGAYLGAYEDIISVSNDAAGYTGQVRLAGYCAGGYAQSGVGESDPVYIDIREAGGREATGHAAMFLAGAKALKGPATSSSDVSDASAGTLYLQSQQDNSGEGAAGPGLAFSRPGSSGRRGALIRARQDGTGVERVGLDFHMGAGTTMTHSVTRQFSMHSNGDFELFANGAGIVLRSPNGTLYTLTVDDAGNPVVT